MVSNMSHLALGLVPRDCRVDDHTENSLGVLHAFLSLFLLNATFNLFEF